MADDLERRTGQFTRALGDVLNRWAADPLHNSADLLEHGQFEDAEKLRQEALLRSQFAQAFQSFAPSFVDFISSAAVSPELIGTPTVPLIPATTSEEPHVETPSIPQSSVVYRRDSSGPDGSPYPNYAITAEKAPGVKKVIRVFEAVYEPNDQRTDWRFSGPDYWENIARYAYPELVGKDGEVSPDLIKKTRKTAYGIVRYLHPERTEADKDNDALSITQAVEKLVQKTGLDLGTLEQILIGEIDYSTVSQLSSFYESTNSSSSSLELESDIALQPEESDAPAGSDQDQDNKSGHKNEKQKHGILTPRQLEVVHAQLEDNSRSWYALAGLFFARDLSGLTRHERAKRSSGMSGSLWQASKAAIENIRIKGLSLEDPTTRGIARWAAENGVSIEEVIAILNKETSIKSLLERGVEPFNRNAYAAETDQSSADDSSASNESVHPSGSETVVYSGEQARKNVSLWETRKINPGESRKIANQRGLSALLEELGYRILSGEVGKDLASEYIAEEIDGITDEKERSELLKRALVQISVTKYRLKKELSDPANLDKPGVQGLLKFALDRGIAQNIEELVELFDMDSRTLAKKLRESSSGNSSGSNGVADQSDRTNSENQPRVPSPADLPPTDGQREEVRRSGNTGESTKREGKNAGVEPDYLRVAAVDINYAILDFMSRLDPRSSGRIYGLRMTNKIYQEVEIAMERLLRENPDLRRRASGTPKSVAALNWLKIYFKNPTKSRDVNYDDNETMRPFYDAQQAAVPDPRTSANLINKFTPSSA